MKVLKKLETIGEAVSTTVQPTTTSTSKTLETTMPSKSTNVDDTTVKNNDITEKPKENILEIDMSLVKEKNKPKENSEVEENNKVQNEKEIKNKEKEPETKQKENMNGKLLSKKINGKNCKCKY